jgi:transcriptional regulator with XRE-family HTH domain
MSPVTEEKRVPLGPVGRYLIENLIKLREVRHLTYRELSDRLAGLGRPIPPLGLSRIEKGARRVDVDDLVALAAVLNVDLAALLLPHTAEGELEVLPGLRVPAREAWRWARGGRPIMLPDDESEAYWATLDFVRRSSPRGVVPAEVQLDHIREAYERMGHES